jgi:hypothetical protein
MALQRTGRYAARVALCAAISECVTRTGTVDGGRFVTELALDERVRDL